MSKLFKKRQILTATLALAMASAIAVNQYYNGEMFKSETSTNVTEQQTNLGDSIYVNGSAEAGNDEVTEVMNTEEYFAKAQLKRTQAHDEALDEIQKLIENKADYKEVETLLDAYTERVKLETDIENLITAKVQSNCLVIVNSEQAEVVVEGDAIDELYMLQITEIVSTQTKIPAENIIIIEAK